MADISSRGADSGIIRSDIMDATDADVEKKDVSNADAENTASNDANPTYRMPERKCQEHRCPGWRYQDVDPKNADDEVWMP